MGRLILPAPGPEPWARQPGEGARPFAAFQIYRDQLPMERSVRRVAAVTGRNRTIIGRWSSRWNWVARVDAWDAEQDSAIRAAQAEANRAYARRLAASGAVMQAKGLGKVRAYIERIDRDGQPTTLRPGQHFTDDLSVAEAVRLIEVGTRLEQTGRGLAGRQESARPAAEAIVANPIIGALTVRPDRLSHVLDAIRAIGTPLAAGPSGGNRARRPPRARQTRL